MILCGLVINAVYFTISPLIANIYVAISLRAVQGIFSVNIGILKLLL